MASSEHVLFGIATPLCQSVWLELLQYYYGEISLRVD